MPHKRRTKKYTAAFCICGAFAEGVFFSVDNLPLVFSQVATNQTGPLSSATTQFWNPQKLVWRK